MIIFNYQYLLLIAVLIPLSQSYDETSKESTSFEDFKIWMKTYEKHYKSSDEISLKFIKFLENKAFVDKLNRIYENKTEFKLNSFADMSPDEFKSNILMRAQSHPLEIPTDKILPSIANYITLPDSFDWRSKGVVTPVKDQGSVGTCWAFSAVGNMEGQFKLKGNKLTNFSVEQIVDCDGTTSNTTEQADCGVYGGWPFLVFDYVQRVGGLESEDDYAYCSGLPKACLPCQPPGYNKTKCGPPVPYCFLNDSCEAKLDTSKFVKGLNVIDWKQTDTNETEIAAALMNIGPLSVAMDATLLQFYHRGIFDPIACNPKELNHAILLVGWGVEKSIFGVKPYWIVKNSWGEKWGEHGYFRIIKDKAKCGINTLAVTAVLA